MSFDCEADAEWADNQRRVVGRCQNQEQQNDVPALPASPHLDEKRRRPRSLGDERNAAFLFWGAQAASLLVSAAGRDELFLWQPAASVQVSIGTDRVLATTFFLCYVIGLSLPLH
jgi:hypothetical protein